MPPSYPARDLVLGAGAIKGFAHAGLLKAVSEWNIPIEDVTGVSMGSIVSLLYTNGYDHNDIVGILVEELDKLALPNLLKRVTLGKAGELLWHGGLFELESLFRELVVRYELHPQYNLKIVASTWNRRPVVFSGVKYDLPRALASSCAVPVLFRPVRVAGALLVDGGVHHPAPTAFSTRPCIVSRLGLATQLSSQTDSWLDYILHAGEVALANMFHPPDARPPHVNVQTAPPDMASLSFSLSRKQYMKMVDFGYKATVKSLKEAKRKGYL